jgi:hypothetical protein
MTHQPPIPEAATPPYPLHPAPIPEEVKQRHEAEAAEAAERAAQEAESGVSPAALGVGAAIAMGAAAAVGGLLFARSRSAKSSRAPVKAGSGSADATKRAAPAAKAKKPGGDDKSKRGAPDRRRVAAGEPYEVAYFARKHGMPAAEARAIIKEAGPDREKANALARRRKTH